MSQPITTLLKTNLQEWLSTRGIWLAFGAALVPFILTAAWVTTHQADLAAGDIQLGENVSTERGWFVTRDGDQATFSATITNDGDAEAGPFNATLAVGTVRQNQFSPLRGAARDNLTDVTLQTGDSRALEITWSARPLSQFRGQAGVLVDVDGENEVGESDEFNNQRFVPLQVKNRVPSPDEAPEAPGNLTGDPARNETTDARVVDVSWSPESPAPRDNATIVAEFENDGPDELVNATVRLELGRPVAGTFRATQETSDTVTLQPGENVTISLGWTARQGSFWVRGWVNVTDDHHDPDASNNYQAEGLTVDPAISEDYEQPESPERLTLKQFYTQLLNILHLRILIPFIGLFYAGGVITDEKRRGNLKYLLVRPIERWLFPVSKLASGYVVAAAAVLLGILASFVVLFGSPNVDTVFLTTSLIVAMAALLVYGAFFVLLGTLVDRPYLIGVGFVIGWEGIVGNFVPWVQNLTIIHHLTEVIDRVDAQEGLVIAAQRLGIVVGAAVAFLVAAALVMKYREFDI